MTGMVKGQEQRGGHEEQEEGCHRCEWTRQIKGRISSKKACWVGTLGARGYAARTAEMKGMVACATLLNV